MHKASNGTITYAQRPYILIGSSVVDPTIPLLCRAIISKFGWKSWHIGQNWVWRRAQKPPLISAMADIWLHWLDFFACLWFVDQDLCIGSLLFLVIKTIFKRYLVMSYFVGVSCRRFFKFHFIDPELPCFHMTFFSSFWIT